MKSPVRNRKRGKPSKPVSTAQWLGLKSEAHDRRATGIPEGAKIAPFEIDDPNPTSRETERIVVIRSISNDPLAWMHAHGRIDDAKYLAGRDWQSLFDRAMLGAVQSVDTTKEPVDGGQWPDLLTDAQAMAIRELRRIADALLALHEGKELPRLIEDVLGRRMFIWQASEIRGGFSDHAKRKWSRELHRALETLATALGYVSVARQGKTRSH